MIYTLESVQDLNFRLGIQIKVQVWRLVNKTSYLLPKLSTEPPKIAKFRLKKSNFLVSKINCIFLDYSSSMNWSLVAELLCLLIAMIIKFQKMCSTFGPILSMTWPDLKFKSWMDSDVRTLLELVGVWLLIIVM